MKNVVLNDYTTEQLPSRAGGNWVTLNRRQMVSVFHPPLKQSDQDQFNLSYRWGTQKHPLRTDQMQIRHRLGNVGVFLSRLQLRTDDVDKLQWKGKLTRDMSLVGWVVVCEGRSSWAFLVTDTGVWMVELQTESLAISAWVHPEQVAQIMGDFEVQ